MEKPSNSRYLRMTDRVDMGRPAGEFQMIRERNRIIYDLFVNQCLPVRVIAVRVGLGISRTFKIVNTFKYSKKRRQLGVKARQWA